MLGVTLVLADGTIASAGGKVVKNVAGYDLGRLVCGSEGRLALIGRVSLRLHPIPKAARTLVIEDEAPATVAGALLRSQLEPSAVDVLHPGRVAVLFEGSASAVAAQLESARSLVGGSEQSGPGAWEESRERQAAAAGTHRFPPGELERFLAGVPEAVVRVGAGVAYTATDAPSSSEPPGDGELALRRLHESVLRAFDPYGTLAG